MLDTFLEKIPKVLIFKVLIPSLAVATLLYGASEYLLGKISYRSFAAVCYVFGIVSFDGFVKYSSIKSLTKLIYEYQQFINLNKRKDKE